MILVINIAMIHDLLSNNQPQTVIFGQDSLEKISNAKDAQAIQEDGFYIDSSTEEQWDIYTPQVLLPKGIYTLTGSYRSGGNNCSSCAYCVDSKRKYKNVCSATYAIKDTENILSYKVILSDKSRIYMNFELQKQKNEEQVSYLIIDSVSISTWDKWLYVKSILSILHIVLVNLILYALLRHRRDLEYVLHQSEIWSATFTTKKRKWYLFGMLFIIMTCRLISAWYLPELYYDEAMIISQINSLFYTGTSLEGVPFPFYVTVGMGVGTYAFIYPVLFFVSLFGCTPWKIRIFLQIILMGSAFFTAGGVYSWNKKIEYFWGTLFSVLMLPWGFVQTNRIWDPCFVPFYFSVFFFLFSYGYNKRSEQTTKDNRCIVGSEAALVLLAVVYPPCRIPAVALWIFTIVLLRKCGRLTKKLFGFIFVVCAVVAMPLAYNILFNDEFNSRSVYMFLFFRGNFGKEFFTFCKNITENFNPTYLFITGDEISRHSLPILGVLGPLSIVPLIYQIRHKMNLEEVMMWFTILLSTISTSLTIDYMPHTLKNCLSWPAFAILITYGWIDFLSLRKKKGKCFWTVLILCQYFLVVAAYILYYRGNLSFLFS